MAASALLPVLFIGGWAIGDALQPASFSPLHETVSVAAGYGGTDRWVVTSSLYLLGVGLFVTAAGLGVLPARTRIVLVVAGAGAIGIASFPEPAHGTTAVHAVFTGIGAVAIAVWPAVLPREGPPAPAVFGTRIWMTATVVSLALLAWTFIETRVGPTLGLAERLSASVQICWPPVVVLALRAQGARVALQGDESAPPGSV